MPTSFALAIHAKRAQSALQFAKAALGNGHRIEQLFFYRAGVENSIEGEQSLAKDWRALIDEHNIPAYLCSASASKYGIDIHQAATLKPFSIGGLTQLIGAANDAERIITFGREHE